MRSIPIPILSAALLAACAQQAAPPAPAESTEPAAAADRYDLRGQWGVSRLGGNTLDMRIPFEGTDDALIWEPACAGQSLRYRTVGEEIEFFQPPQAGERIVCDIGYPGALPRVIEALEGRWTVDRQTDGDLLLTRGEDRIELEKMPTESVATLDGEWRVAGIDGESFDEPYGIALSGDEDEIWWEPRCAGQSIRYRIVNERFIVIEPPETPPPPPGAEPPPPPAVCAIGLPGRLSDVMNAMRAADRIERTPANGIRLSGNGRSLTLFSQ